LPEAFEKDTAVNATGGYSALYHATRGWKKLRRGELSTSSSPWGGVFIATGNVTPFYPNPIATTLGAPQAALVHLIELATKNYKAAGDRLVHPYPCYEALGR
jgi:hypothetical protein